MSIPHEMSLNVGPLNKNNYVYFPGILPLNRDTSHRVSIFGHSGNETGKKRTGPVNETTT